MFGGSWAREEGIGNSKSNDNCKNWLEKVLHSHPCRGEAATWIGEGDGVGRTPLLRVTDQFGRIRPIANDPIMFEITGPAQLIGDSPFSLVSGTGAIWIRARQQPGVVIVRAKHLRLGTRQVTLTLKQAGPERV